MEKNHAGLTSAEASKKILQFGPNIIFRPVKISFLGIALHEITEPMILLLFVVGFFYSLWGKPEDALTIFAVISALVLVEVYNEFRAKKAIASLEEIAALKARVLRDGKIIEIGREAIVPEDILILGVGTKIAADAVLRETAGLQVDESALTGESFSVDKKSGDEIYAGTIVVSGEGEAQVFDTGGKTKLGKIAATLKEIKPPKTALQLAMKSLTGKLLYVALFFSVLIPVIGILRGQDFKIMILTGLSLSFATIPEELPIIITMVLGLGSYTLSKSNFLVKKIKSAEVLGGATVIVTDKTGTITEGKMKVADIYPGGKEKEILGNALAAISEYSFSSLDKEIKDVAGKNNIVKAFGEIFRQRSFSSEKKTKAIIRKSADNYEIFSSGAPEEIFSVCSHVAQETRQELDKLASQGKRVIAVAFRQLNPGEEVLDFGEIEKNLFFSGLIGFEDPPRQGVKETIVAVGKAGIKTIMVTGDYPATAKYVAQAVGILNQHQILTGEELDGMSDRELKDAVEQVSVFARTTPQHKYRIVKVLQENGEVVAVTGDGINDVLALKAADIGIAMGIKGTDVARDAAEIVLADDNYITITQGIFEGRKFFDNLQKGIKYYLSVKSALVLIFFLPVILGISLPFSPIQIILLELFMDLAASAGFVMEPQESSIYSRSPRNPKESIFSGKAIKDFLTKGIFLFFAVMTVYFWASLQGLSVGEIQTFSFSAWIFGHIILAFISRSDREPLVSLGLFKNKIINFWAISAIGFLLLAIYLPALGRNFNLVRIGPLGLITAAAIVALIMSLLEIKKRFIGFTKNTASGKMKNSI